MRRAAKQNALFRLRGLKKNDIYLILYCVTLRRLSLVPTCPKNCKNQGFLRFSDVSDSYDQWQQRIPDIPDGRPFLRRDRKSRKQSPTSAIFTTSVNMKFACLGHRRCLSLSFLATKAWFSVNYRLISISNRVTLKAITQKLPEKDSNTRQNCRSRRWRQFGKYSKLSLAISA